MPNGNERCSFIKWKPKTDSIWFKACDINIFACMSYKRSSCSSALTFYLRIDFIYVCNLFSKWDEHSMFFCLKQSGKIKKKRAYSLAIFFFSRSVLSLSSSPFVFFSSEVKRSFYFYIRVCCAYTPKDDDNKIGPFYIRFSLCGLRCTPSFRLVFRLHGERILV